MTRLLSDLHAIAVAYVAFQICGGLVVAAGTLEALRGYARG